MKDKFKKLCLLVPMFIAGLAIARTDVFADETVVPMGEPQYPSTKADGAYWYNAVWKVNNPLYGKTRVVNDKTMPARSFFIPVFSEEEAGNEVINWRDFSGWQSLNGNWNFKLVEKPADVITNFHEENYKPGNDWINLPVPSSWQMHENGIDDQPMYSNWYYHWGQKGWLLISGEPNIPGEKFDYKHAYKGTAPKNINPVGHYIKDFTLKQDHKDDTVILNFQGVESAFYVYVNGQYVGYSEDSFSQHEFDITPYLHKDSSNRLAVLVYRWSDGSLLENQDLVNYSGIFRDVGLIYRSKSAPLLDFRNVVKKDGNNAKLTTSFLMKDDTRVNVKLYDGNTVVAEGNANGSTDDYVPVELEVKNAKFWNTDEPFQYHQVFTTYDKNGKVGEYVGWDFGLREVSLLNTDNGKTTYAMNDAPIVFKGVNRHEIYNKTGRAQDTELLHKDLQLMKQNNINAIRTSHYPNNVDLYLWAAKYGLMIMDEANMETHAAGGLGGIPMAVETFRYPSLHRCANMYERDKNMTSVVAWSNGNECIFFMPPAVNDKYSFRLMYKYIKERDDQRPIVLERDPREGVSDIRSRMYWPASEHSIGYSIFEGIQGNDKKVLEASDKRPYLQVEYAHSMGNSLGYYKEYWALWKQYPHAMGGFIWDWVDQSPLWPLPEGKTATGMSYNADGTKVVNGGTHYYAYGGDWARDKNNNFNNFMDNGIIASDRTAHAGIDQVKYVQQNIVFKNFNKDSNTVDIANEMNVSTDNYEIVLSLWKDGIRLNTKDGAEHLALPTAIKPRSTQTVTLPSLDSWKLDGSNPITDTKAQYYLRVQALYKDSRSAGNRSWAKAGDVSAYEEFKLNEVDKLSYRTPVDVSSPLTVKEEDGIITVKSNRIEYKFSKNDGQWISWKKDGVEFLAQKDDGSPDFKTTDNRSMIPGMYANFWRAPVDNDRENNWLKRVSRWREANWWRDKIKIQVQQTNKNIVTFDVTSKYNNGSNVTEKYTIYGDGHIQYAQDLNPGPKSEIPAYGFMVEMPNKFNNLKWFGKGLHTTFVDRYEGYPTEIYSEKVDENSLGDFVKPQENGNHVGVYWANISDEGGNSLFVKTIREPIEVMASPYNAYDVTDKSHPYELLTTNRTYFRVGYVAGVGGENSWGARPLPYAEIQAEPHSMAVDIFPITANKKGEEKFAAEDFTKLYRTLREDSEFITKVEYSFNKEGKFVELKTFQDDIPEYKISAKKDENIKDPVVKVSLADSIKDKYKVVYEKDPEDDNAVIVKILSIENSANPYKIYKFQFISGKDDGSIEGDNNSGNENPTNPDGNVIDTETEPEHGDYEDKEEEKELNPKEKEFGEDDEDAKKGADDASGITTDDSNNNSSTDGGTENGSSNGDNKTSTDAAVDEKPTHNEDKNIQNDTRSETKDTDKNHVPNTGVESSLYIFISLSIFAGIVFIVRSKKKN